ncbi:hypothetical protein GH733_000166 [Mirounga leonina]|nr:hypothetical protein GH733_000166 [Mirounga leonina]
MSTDMCGTEPDVLATLLRVWKEFLGGYRNHAASDHSEDESERVGAASAHAQPGQCRQNHHPLKKCNGEDISTTSLTLGFNTKSLEHGELKLNPWDEGGQRSVRSSWWTWYKAQPASSGAGRQPELQSLCGRSLAGATPRSANKQDLLGALFSNTVLEASEPGSIQTPRVHRGDPPIWH